MLSWVELYLHILAIQVTAVLHVRVSRVKFCVLVIHVTALISGGELCFLIIQIAAMLSWIELYLHFLAVQVNTVLHASTCRVELCFLVIQMTATTSWVELYLHMLVGYLPRVELYLHVRILQMTALLHVSTRRVEFVSLFVQMNAVLGRAVFTNTCRLDDCSVAYKYCI